MRVEVTNEGAKQRRTKARKENFLFFASFGFSFLCAFV
jgi:hypothetical protein